MNFRRIVNHLSIGKTHIKRHFPSLTRIEQAITESERQHNGQIRFAVEANLELTQLYHQLSARDRAIDVFSQLRVWDTEHNNGVLIYLLLADRDIEIIADRGIHSKLNPKIWQEICENMEQSFREQRFEQGVLAGIHAITQHLAHHFPVKDNQINELADEAIIL